MMKDNSRALKDIIKLIDSCEFSPHDMIRLNEVMRSAWERSQRAQKRKFSVGDHVEFRPQRGVRRGHLITGVIEKINRKNIDLIDDNLVRWRVTPSLLSVAKR